MINSPPMDLVIFGIQGSGKGTQAKKLAEEFGYDIFEAGGELRRIADSGSGSAAPRTELRSGTGGLGAEVKSYIDAGKLVPHAIIMRVVAEAIRARPKTRKLLFDGIPRDRDQMRDFTEIMRKIGREFRCIHITLDPEAGIERILKRAKIEGRADDAQEETIRKRMRIFTEKTLPVIECFASEGKVTEVDGKGTTEEVYARLKRAVSCEL